MRAHINGVASTTQGQRRNATVIVTENSRKMRPWWMKTSGMKPRQAKGHPKDENFAGAVEVAFRIDSPCSAAHDVFYNGIINKKTNSQGQRHQSIVMES
jgi:hypothetical protein